MIGKGFSARFRTALAAVQSVGRRFFSIIIFCIMFFAWGQLVQVAHAAIEISDGSLVSYYTLDDATAVDSLGTHNGTSNNVTYTQGKINNGGSFNGSNSYIPLASPIVLNNATYATWVKTTAGGQINAAYLPNVSGGNSYVELALAVDQAGKVQFLEGYPFVGHGTIINSNTSVNDGNWHLIVGTREGGTYKVYVDGNLENTVTGGTTGQTNTVQEIGAQNLAGTQYGQFNGELDEYGIWSRALSQTEVTSLYNGGAGVEVCVTKGCGAPYAIPDLLIGIFLLFCLGIAIYLRSRRDGSPFVIALILLISLVISGVLYSVTRKVLLSPTMISSPIFPATEVPQSAATTQSATHQFPVPPVVIWQDGALSPNTITLNSVSITPSLSIDQSVTKSNLLLSLGFKIASGPGVSGMPAGNAPPLFCSSEFQTTVKRLYNEKGDTTGPDSIDPVNDCIGKNTTMDNVKVNFTVPEPGTYTFVVSGPGASAITNFSVTILPTGAPIVQGPATEGSAASSTFSGSTGRTARDAQRVSDLRQIQNDLELYFNKCGYYPGAAANPNCSPVGGGDTYATMAAALVGTPTLGIANVPNDPNTGTTYLFADPAPGTTYVLGAMLEDSASAYLAQDVDGIMNGVNCNDPVYCVRL